MNTEGTRPQDLRTKNCRRLLQILSETDSRTVNEIVARMGLSRTAVQNILSRLIDSGMVMEGKKRSSTKLGGKRAASYTIAPAYKYSFFIYLNSSSAVAELNNFALERLDYQIADLTRLSYQEMVQQLAKLILTMLQKARLDIRELYGIAVAVSGMVDAEKGILLEFTGSDTYGGWGQNRNLAQDLCRCLEYDLDIYIDNMCNFSGYASCLSLMGGEAGSCVYVMAHNCGIGAAYVKNGQVERGSHSLLGEIGHVTVDYENGYQCRCGRRGCFEAMLYPENIRQRLNQASDLKKLDGRGIEQINSVDDLLRAAQRGNAYALTQLQLIGRYFAKLFYNIQLMADPDCIIFHDAYSVQLDILHRLIETACADAEKGFLRVPIKILFDTSMFTEQVRRGAAVYLRNRFLDRTMEEYTRV